MSLMNYHELTMNESNDSPARKAQFRIICAIMGGCFVYSVLTSGVLRPVKVEMGQFPGGDFVYKYTGRDYAASNSLLQAVANDLNMKEKEHGNTMYNLYLDDPLVINGRNQRFASGILLNKDTETNKHETNKERKAVLLGMNDDMIDPTEQEVEELAAHHLWVRLKYKDQKMPKVKAAVAQFDFTNGFVSALVHSYKVFPAIRKYAKEHGASGLVPVVVTTCDIKAAICTHYVPLENAEPFRLGQPEQKAQLGSGIVNWKGIEKMAWDIKDLILKYTPFGPKSSKETPSDGEL